MTKYHLKTRSSAQPVWSTFRHTHLGLRNALLMRGPPETSDKTVSAELFNEQDI